VSGHLWYVGRSIPLIGKLIRRADFVPPAPLRNPGLTIPPHRNLARDVKINVKVYVNPSGKVDYSEVLSKVPETDRDLAVLAMFSARRWEFVPARSVDGTVPGMIRHYEFGPAARADEIMPAFMLTRSARSPLGDCCIVTVLQVLAESLQTGGIRIALCSSKPFELTRTCDLDNTTKAEGEISVRET
jgi:hypothetical protein